MTDDEQKRVNNLCLRLDIMMNGLRRAIEDCEDNPVRHLTPCKCGRGWSRSTECSICVMERMRRERGL
jgi:hypothetical protein